MKKTLDELWSETTGPTVEYEGLTVHGVVFRHVKRAGCIKVRFLKAVPKPVQALKIHIDTGTLFAMETICPKMVLRLDTSPELVEVRYRASNQGSRLAIYNAWINENDGVDAWLTNAGMLVEETGDKMILRCSDGRGEPTFNDLVVEIQFLPDEPDPFSETAFSIRTGCLERILTRRYGTPIPCIRDGLAAKIWNYARPNDQAKLYMGMKWLGKPGAYFACLRDVYGDSFGGILIQNSLRAAVLLPRQLPYVRNIYELQMQPAVQHALVLDPDIKYFMEADNSCFYGIKAGALHVFDAEYDELYSMGPVEPAMEALMDRFAAP